VRAEQMSLSQGAVALARTEHLTVGDGRHVRSGNGQRGRQRLPACRRRGQR
jgi:hypothetical protein